MENELKFTDASEKHMNFLTEYGFLLVANRDYECIQKADARGWVSYERKYAYIKYEKEDCQIRIISDLREVESYYECLGEKIKVDVDRVLNHFNIEGERGFYQCGKGTIEDAIVCISKAIKRVMPLFNGEYCEILKEIKEKEETSSKKAQLEQGYIIDMKKAEIFWKEKDFARCAELLKKNESSLSKIQRMRLEYSLKRIKR